MIHCTSLLASTVLIISALLVAEQAMGFMAGVSDCGSDALAISQMKQLNATVSRRYVFWKNVEPELTELNTSLTIAELKAHPKELIYDWAETKEWNWPDQEVHSLVDAGLEPLIEVGEGHTTDCRTTTAQLPIPA